MSKQPYEWEHVNHIEELTAENERLRGALEAIRDHHRTLDWNEWNDPTDALVFMQDTAKKALKENSDG